MKMKGKLVCATEFTPDEISAINEKFNKLFDAEIDFEVSIDQALISGFVATVNNMVYDLSAKSYLDRMQDYIGENTVQTNHESIEDIIDALKKNVDGALAKTSVGAELKDKITQFDVKYDISMIGIVERTGDGVVFVRGLEGCKYGELLQFENEAYGIVLNLEMDRVGAVLLNGVTDVTEGSMVRHTGDVVKVPVGDAVLGRVINPLGLPIDGRGKILTEESRPIETPAPAIIDRQSVDTPLQTGILAIDSMIPIGRGQRELIIGDRQTGKTAIAVDTIINQKGKNVKCVYVAIAQKASTIAEIVNSLDGLYDCSCVNGKRYRANAVYCALCGLCDCGKLYVCGRGRFDRLRRSFQACGSIQDDVPAASQAAGTRGVSWRRILFAFQAS